ncbi:hypothetical protein GVAV_000061 [Gurleya vavrai]
MDITDNINHKITNRDSKSLAFLFNLNNKSAFKNFKSINFDNLIQPFDDILFLQKELNLNPSIETAEAILLTFKSKYLEEDWCLEVFDKIVFNLFTTVYNFKKIEKNNLIINSYFERIAKIFQGLFKEIFDLKQNNIRKHFLMKIFNYLVCLYTSLENTKMIDNLFTVFHTKINSEITKDNKIYSFYLGCYYLRIEKFNLAFDCLKYSFLIKNDLLKKEILPFLFFSALCCKKYIKNEILDYYGYFDYIKLQNSIISGNFTQINEYIDTCNYKFIRLLITEIYYLTYKNLFSIIYNFNKMENKLYLNDIADLLYMHKCKIELKELQCILLNLIAKGFVKGYLNITKNVVVLSKENPFPLN